MTANVTVSVIEQLRCGNMYELAESSGDDTNEEGKTEKVKEKASFTFSFHASLLSGSHDPFRRKICLLGNHERLVSETYAALPERPPRVQD